jgi:hypothetical protein
VLRIDTLLPATQHSLRAALLHLSDICGHGSPENSAKPIAQPEFGGLSNVKLQSCKVQFANYPNASAFIVISSVLWCFG